MLNSKSKKIWIDLDNSPHVPFFAPVIRELERRSYKVVLTVRDCFQVCGLADLHRFKYTRIGKHYGKHLLLKIFGTIYRSLQLIPIAYKEKVDLALSHGSRSQLIVSKILRLPSILINDYEHSSGLKFFHPDTFIFPELITINDRNRSTTRILKYPGIKEDVYAPDFVADPGIFEDFGIKENDILVTVRPPATEAHYHNPESETLFEGVMDYIGSKENVKIFVLPRNEKKQGDFIRSRWAELIKEGKLIIPEKVVDGLNLIWHSDFVVSGGGTMNREAAALKVPVYSIFRGKIGAVDKYLSDNGHLTLLENAMDLKTKMKIISRDKSVQFKQGSYDALQVVVKHIVEILEENGR